MAFEEMKNTMNDFWLCYKKYYGQQQTEGFWDACTGEFNALEKKYNGSTIAKSLHYSFLEDLVNAGRQVPGRAH